MLNKDVRQGLPLKPAIGCSLRSIRCDVALVIHVLSLIHADVKLLMGMESTGRSTIMREAANQVGPPGNQCNAQSEIKTGLVFRVRTRARERARKKSSSLGQMMEPSAIQ